MAVKAIPVTSSCGTPRGTEGRRASGADHAVRRARAFSGSVPERLGEDPDVPRIAVGARVRRGRAFLARPVPTVLGSRSGRRASAPERVRRMPCARGPVGSTGGGAAGERRGMAERGAIRV